MLDRLCRAAFAVIAPLLLASCVLTPGKFVSTLTINADRSFSFSYVGEVVNAEPQGSSMLDPPDSASDDDTTKPHAPTAAEIARKKAKADAANRQIATALAKEAGYRQVRYIGDGVFMVDFAIKGRLDHLFIWPFNVDAETVLPFIAVELRQDGVVRMKAPAFAADQNSGVPGLNDLPGNHSPAENRLDGTFTLDTDAAVISQNNEDGVKPVGTRKTMTWHASPALKSAPTAVLKLAALAP